MNMEVAITAEQESKASEKKQRRDISINLWGAMWLMVMRLCTFKGVFIAAML